MVDVTRRHIDLVGPEARHRIYNGALGIPLSQKAYLVNGVQNPGCGLAVNDDDMRDLRVPGKFSFNVLDHRNSILCVAQDRVGDPVYLGHGDKSLAVSPVGDDEGLSGGGDDRGNYRFHGKGTASLHKRARIVCAETGHLKKPLANIPYEANEVRVPGADVLEHRLFYRFCRREGTGSEKNPVAYHVSWFYDFHVVLRCTFLCRSDKERVAGMGYPQGLRLSHLYRC